MHIFPAQMSAHVYKYARVIHAINVTHLPAHLLNFRLKLQRQSFVAHSYKLPKFQLAASFRFESNTGHKAT